MAYHLLTHWTSFPILLSWTLTSNMLTELCSDSNVTLGSFAISLSIIWSDPKVSTLKHPHLEKLAAVLKVFLLSVIFLTFKINNTEWLRKRLSEPFINLKVSINDLRLLIMCFSDNVNAALNTPVLHTTKTSAFIKTSLLDYDHVIKFIWFNSTWLLHV